MASGTGDSTISSQFVVDLTETGTDLDLSDLGLSTLPTLLRLLPRLRQIRDISKLKPAECDLLLDVFAHDHFYLLEQVRVCSRAVKRLAEVAEKEARWDAEEVV